MCIVICKVALSFPINLFPKPYFKKLAYTYHAFRTSKLPASTKHTDPLNNIYDDFGI